MGTPTKAHKTHRYIDCTGFPWRTTKVERMGRTATDLKLVTCGACKQRIINAISAADWRDLDAQTLDVLDLAASQAV